ncbi:MAG: pyridoxal-phosphate dependent enzyme, partial [Cyclobacteriaceae bacterium]
MHPLVPGNKFYKLKYNLLEAKKNGHHTLLTFGGAYSNHILATAHAAKQEGFKAIGMIRGEINYPLNPTLFRAVAMGMQLEALSRKDYREKNTEKYIFRLREKFGRFYLLPEGGTNHLAIKGCVEILSQDDLQYDLITVPIGTGGTFCGLLANEDYKRKVLGFSVLKGDFIYREIEQLLSAHQIRPQCNWEIINRYHFGGYAKYKPELIRFMSEFYHQTKIPLDPIYTSKMMFGLMDMIKSNHFPPEMKILVLHTGGLQGIDGYAERFKINL